MDVAARRLVNQRVVGELFDRPEDVVRHLLGVQAQDYNQALWAVGLRTKGCVVGDVEAALADGKIVRSWPMRGTLHFTAPEDLKWMLRLMASRILAASARRWRELELDEQTFARSGELLAEALRGGRRLTRPEMLELFEKDGISTQGQRGYHMLGYHAQNALVCLGPMAGKQQTIVLLDEWVPNSRELDGDEALGELARRYFAGREPATEYDLAGWGGITVTDARRGMAVAGYEPVQADDEAPEGCHLLAGFDEYLLGYKDRDAVLAPRHADKVVPGRNGVFFPIMVADGQVVGTWKRVIKKNAVTITLRPFGRLPGARKRFSGAAARYAEFLGLPLSLEI